MLSPTDPDFLQYQPIQLVEGREFWTCTRYTSQSRTQATNADFPVREDPSYQYTE